MRGIRLALLTDTGFVESAIALPVVPTAELFEGGDDALLLVCGDDLSKSQVEAQLQGIVEWTSTPARPVVWQSLYVMYVFTRGDPSLAEFIAAFRKKPASCLVLGGYIDFASNSAAVAHTLVVPDFLGSLARAWQSGAATVDAETFDRRMAEEKAVRERFEARMALVTPWGTRSIFIACTLLYLVTATAGGGRDTLIQFGGQWGPGLQRGEWYRLWGATFLHLNFLHLFMNMITLLVVGRMREQTRLPSGHYVDEIWMAWTGKK